MAAPHDTTIEDGAAALSTLSWGARGRDGEVYVVVADGARLLAVAIQEKQPLIIGRAEDAGITLEDAKASRHHARIERRDGRVFLVDLGSRNGTKVQGTVLRNGERELAPGDAITIGNATLTLASVTPEPAATSDDAEDDEDDADDPGFVMADPAMLRLFHVVERFARVDIPVLVLGETGVGKEVIASQLHALSPRGARGPFVTLNCAALPEAIIESELFGHEKGAFTGADKRKTGFLEAADKGTLLLDELGDMPLATQVKLLRFLETRRLTRLGSTNEITVDVRIVAATHRDLHAAISAGRFREDLYYRLSACTVKIPPLRDRPKEIAPLAALFARRVAVVLDQPPPVFDPEALRVLLGYSWPGNIRELRNAIEHAVVMSDGRTVRADALPDVVRGGSAARSVGDDAVLPVALESIERDRIVQALTDEGHNQSRAAKRLGISRRALIYKMKKYAIASERRTK